MNVAFIPVRGGSKSIPLKNIKPICGRPLVYWTAKAACQCKYIDVVYIATDDEKIRQIIVEFKEEESDLFSKIQVIGRSEESASDTASTEFAMLEFAEQYEFDNVVLIQATSPLLTTENLDGGFELFYSEGTDSVLSVARQKRFLWEENDAGDARPSNYDIFYRPRRQNFKGYLVENGAFYITSKDNLIKFKNRISGRIKLYEMCEDSAFELDEPSDWIIVEALMRKNKISNKFIHSPKIKMFLTDCDGCLTDSGMYYSEHGDELKKFNTRDGMGFAMLRERGILTGIVTSEKVELNHRRVEKLKLDILEEGCTDKAAVVKHLCNAYQIGMENVVYIGDDVNDLEVVRMVGLGCCPSDAVSAVKKVASFITQAKGGEGVIREVADKILEQQ